MNVIPIYTTNHKEGYGFLISHYFVTCGHVISVSENPSISLGGMQIALTNPLFFEDNRISPYGYDLAIYNLEDNICGLELIDSENNRLTDLRLQYGKGIGGQQCECNIEIAEYHEGNYFSGLSDENLQEGCSGSPLFSQGKVAGMIVKGNNDGNNNPVNPSLPLNFCVFLSSNAIKNVLCKITE